MRTAGVLAGEIATHYANGADYWTEDTGQEAGESQRRDLARTKAAIAEDEARAHRKRIANRIDQRDYC